MSLIIDVNVTYNNTLYMCRPQVYNIATGFIINNNYNYIPLCLGYIQFFMLTVKHKSSSTFCNLPRSLPEVCSLAKFETVYVAESAYLVMVRSAFFSNSVWILL